MIAEIHLINAVITKIQQCCIYDWVVSVLDEQKWTTISEYV